MDRFVARLPSPEKVEARLERLERHPQAHERFLNRWADAVWPDNPLVDELVTEYELRFPQLQNPTGTWYWCVGSWEFVTDDGPDPYWRAPHQDILVGLLDLRTLAQAGQAGGVPEGAGLFVFDRNPSDPAMLCKIDNNEDGAELTTLAERGFLDARFATTRASTAESVCGYYLELAVDHATAIGLNIGSLNCRQSRPFN